MSWFEVAGVFLFAAGLVGWGFVLRGWLDSADS